MISQHFAKCTKEILRQLESEEASLTITSMVSSGELAMIRQIHQFQKRRRAIRTCRGVTFRVNL